MPPENCDERPLGGLLEPELLEQAPRGRAGVRRAQPLQAPEEPQVLGRREVLVDRRVLAGDADQLADAMRLAGHVDAEDLGVARVDRQQRREHPQHRGLAGAVRPEDAEDLALADLEVDAVDGAQVAERLHQPARVDGCCLCHVCSSGCKHPMEARSRRFQRPYAGVSRGCARANSAASARPMRISTVSSAARSAKPTVIVAPLVAFDESITDR